MKKTIIIFDYLNNGEEIYNLLLQKKLERKYEIIFIQRKSNRRNITFIDKFMRKFAILQDINPIILLNLLLFKKSIVIACSTFKFQRLLSKNIIYLSHGWGGKKTPGHNQKLDKENILTHKITYESTKYMICHSDFDDTYYFRDKYFDHSKRPIFLSYGSPRNDYFIRNKDNHKILKELSLRLNIDKDEYKVFLIAPTQRETIEKSTNLMKKYYDEFTNIDKKLGKNKIKFLFRPHQSFIGISDQFADFKNITLVGSDDYPDPRPIMLFSDVLITDYSSIYNDYLLLQRKIIFYPFDLEDYKKMRGLVIDFNNPIHAPGPQIKELNEILELTDNDFRKYDLEKSAKFYHKYRDDKSTERVVELILNELKNL